jgi:hypothetical protein
MNDWPVKLPTRIRPQLEQIAAEEFIPVPTLVRSLVERAIFERQLERAKRDPQSK